jgi:hypothetical protein
MNDDAKPESPQNGAEPAGETSQAATDLWAVSFGENDDRELTSSEIASAIERGEINGETIVWRPGMGDWQPLSERPELAALIERPEPPTALPESSPPESSPPESSPPKSLPPESAPPASTPPVSAPSISALPEPKPSQPPPLAEPLEEIRTGFPARWRAHVALGAVVVAAALLVIVWGSTRGSQSAASQPSVEPAPSPPATTAPPAPAAPAATLVPSTSASVAPPPGAPDYFTFDRLRALRQLAALAERAARCRGRGAPSGTVRTMVTFEPAGGAPSSVRVTQAPYAGTPTATCIVKKLATAKVPAFRGPAVTLRVPVELR